MAAIDDPFLKRSEVADLLGVSVRSIEGYEAPKLIPAPIRIGKHGHPCWRRS